MQDWRWFEDPRFAVRFRYPLTTPRGEPVAAVEEVVDDAVRIHLRSASREVYVELTRYPPTPADDEYRAHKPYLEARFGAGSVTVLTGAQLGARTVQTYAFAWPDGERVVHLVPTATATYRLIHDPRAPLNREILTTLQLPAPDRCDQ